MRTRWLVLAMAAVTLSLACTNGDSDATSTTIAPTQSGPACFYLAGYVAVPTAQVGDAISALGTEPIDPSSILDATTAEGETAPEGSEREDIAAQISQAVGYFQLNDGDDPVAVSEELNADGITASPIHLLGFANHIRFQPGTDPSPIVGYELPDVSESLDGDLVAVVDSGIVAPLNDGLPDWFHGRDGDTPYVLYDPLIDSEVLSTENPASHGTFISGLIRQVAPTKQVTFAAARLANTSDPDLITLRGDAELPAGLAPTAEIQVAEAIARLMVRHPTSQEISALNLSLGSYGCAAAGSPDLVTMTAMIQLWLTKYQGTAVMAAAGNELYPASATAPNELIPFYPAALSPGTAGVHAVAAVDLAGNEIVWSNKSPQVILLDRSWVSERAPGADLVNLSGAVSANGEVELVCWSGSSFATALASAAFANNGDPAPRDYNLVKGLTYVSTDAGVITVPRAEATSTTVREGSTTAQVCDRGDPD